MKGEPVLQIRDISYSYEEGIMALDHVSLDIGSGQRIAVIGANGAGKSTFFLILNGVLNPDRGRLLFKGTEILKKNLKELRKHVGIVFQDADSQIIASTVSAEVSFGPMNLKLSREEVERRTKQALVYMNLQEFGERAPHYLSGGEKKRVTIADILAMEPEVIIFDEPAATLDPANQQMLEAVLERMAKEGRTLLVSTHDVDFAYRFADRVLVFSEGRVIADGAPETVFCREAVLEAANLRKPVMLELQQILTERGIIKDGSDFPKTVKELSELL